MRTPSMDSYSSVTETLKDALEFHLTSPERHHFDLINKKEGFLQKKSSNMMVGWQERYFKI